MNADGSKPGSAVIEQFLLALLAAIRFVDHDRDSHLLSCRNQTFHQLPGHRFEEGSVGDAEWRSKARIFRDYVTVEAFHQDLRRFTRQINESGRVLSGLDWRVSQANHEIIRCPIKMWKSNVKTTAHFKMKQPEGRHR